MIDVRDPILDRPLSDHIVADVFVLFGLVVVRHAADCPACLTRADLGDRTAREAVVAVFPRTDDCP